MELIDSGPRWLGVREKPALHSSGRGGRTGRRERKPGSNAVRVRRVRDPEGPRSLTQKPRKGFLATPVACHCGVPKLWKAQDKGGIMRLSENLCKAGPQEALRTAPAQPDTPRPRHSCPGAQEGQYGHVPHPQFAAL